MLYGDVWRRTELSARDRSLVTISVLIATGKSAQLVGHLGRALNNGVQPKEASGVLTHLLLEQPLEKCHSADATLAGTFGKLPYT